MQCIMCQERPAAGKLTLTQRTGFLVYRTTKIYNGDFCLQCAKRLMQKVQIHTLAVGWIGTISLFLMPITVVTNFYRYYQFKSSAPSQD